MPARIISVSGRNVQFDDGEYIEFTVMFQEENKRYNSARFVGSPDEVKVVVSEIQEKGGAWQDLKPLANIKHPFA